LRKREWWEGCWLKRRVYLDKIESVERERARRIKRRMRRRRRVNRIVPHCLLHQELEDMQVQQRGRWKVYGYGKRVVEEIGDS
jgi:hypothetical protein